MNATCEGDARWGALSEQASALWQNGAHERAGDKLDEALDLAEPSWERQRDLAETVPPGDAKAYRRYLAVRREFQGAVRRMPDAIREGDTDTLSFLGETVVDIRKKRLRAAITLGADNCGQ